MPSLASINGKITPLEHATVPVMDRGYLFGDGVYEVMIARHGQLFALERHLQRFARSLREVRIEADLDTVRRHVETVVQQSQIETANVYCHVTRGTEDHRSHVWDASTPPTIVVIVTPKFIHPPEYFEKGVAIVSREDIRWARCDIKAITLLPNVLARQSARDDGAFEAVFVKDGRVTEGTATGVLMIQNGEIFVPPKGPRILSSVTRDVVLECAENENIPVREQSRPLDDYYHADEICLVGTTTDIMPVRRIDQHDLPAPGPITRRLIHAFQQTIDNQDTSP